MRLACRAACVAYFALLTTLLLAPDPAALIGLSDRPQFPWGSFGIHWIALAGLGFLAPGSFWPRPISRPLVAALVIYGTAGELLQWFVPSRHVRWDDWAQNMLGVASGLLIYWLVWRKWAKGNEPATSAAALGEGGTS
jgi:hypothetical protein